MILPEDLLRKVRVESAKLFTSLCWNDGSIHRPPTCHHDNGELALALEQRAFQYTLKTQHMKTLLINNLVPILAQATSGSLTQGASKAMGIVMLIGFIFGTICVVGGGFAIRRGDTDAGKLSIIGGLIIAGAPVIVKALFTAFGIDSSTVDVGTFQ